MNNKGKIVKLVGTLYGYWNALTIQENVKQLCSLELHSNLQ